MTRGLADSRNRRAMTRAMHFVIAFWLLLPAGAIGENPNNEEPIFNGVDLTGWKGNPKFWSVEDQQIVGRQKEDLNSLEYLWTAGEQSDFYLSVRVLQLPTGPNSGIQFRSTALANGHAHGYQFDIVRRVYGMLYHESGRGYLSPYQASGSESPFREGEWNHLEILAVGHDLWGAINGKVTFAVHDSDGESGGRIGLQLHPGTAQEIRFKEFSFRRQPEIAIANLKEPQLRKLLQIPVQNAIE